MLAITPLLAQYGTPQRRRTTRTDVGRGGKLEAQPLVTFHGVVKEIGKKSMTIEAADEQLVTMEINRKTKFLKGTKSIASSTLHEGSPVSVEVSGQPPGMLVAVNVFAEQPAAPASSP